MLCFQEGDTDAEVHENIDEKAEICEGEEIREADSTSPAVHPSSLSTLHGEEVADLSPRSISMLEAGEGAGKQGIEKLLLVSGVNNSQANYLYFETLGVFFCFPPEV